MRYVLTLGVLCSLVSAAACTAENKPRQMTDEQKTVYALGVMVGRSLETFALSPEEIELLQAGIKDASGEKLAIDDVDAYREKVQALQEQRLVVVENREKEAGAAYSARAAEEKGATRTASGIVISTLTPGTGAAPTATDRVKVHYEGKLIDGQVFDSSVERGEPVTFPLEAVIPCWTEALQHMKVGGKSRFICPSDAAYGSRGSPPLIRPGATLVFDVELLEIVK